MPFKKFLHVCQWMKTPIEIIIHLWIVWCFVRNYHRWSTKGNSLISCMMLVNSCRVRQFIAFMDAILCLVICLWTATHSVGDKFVCSSFMLLHVFTFWKTSKYVGVVLLIYSHLLSILVCLLDGTKCDT